METGVSASKEQLTGPHTSYLTARFQTVNGFFIDAITANAATRRTSTQARPQITTLIASKPGLIHRRQTFTVKTFATDTNAATFRKMTSGSLDTYALKA
jgi:hypothetical protein